MSNSEWVAWKFNRPKDRDILAVNWLLTNACNYRCHYCDDEVHNGSIPTLSLNQILEFIDSLCTDSKDKRVFFEFNGGEVTYFPGIESIFKKIKEKKGYCGIISNGSRPLKWWKEQLPYLDSVLLSFHQEFCDPEHFVSLLKLLNQQSHIKTHVNVMMDPARFDYCLDVARKIKKQSVASISLQRLLENHNKQNENMYPYSEEQRVSMGAIKTEKFLLRSLRILLRKKPVEFRGLMKKVYSSQKEETLPSDYLITHGQSRFKGWTCQAGLQNLAIDWNGDIYRGQCHEGGKMGSISTPFTSTKIEPIVCQRDFCYCGFDLLCEKEIS